MHNIVKGTHMFRLLIQAAGDEFFEDAGVAALQLGRVVLWDEEEHSHGMEVCVWGLPRSQLNTRDAQGPDVSLWERGVIWP